MDLVNKLWNFCHTLRHEGVDYSDYIEELTYLLFLKIASERGIKIPKDCSWGELIKYDEEKLLINYNVMLTKLSKRDDILGDIFIQPIAKIRNASSLKKLLNLIDEVNWTSYNEDVLGSMFEGLLEKAASESKKGAGQYFTPRPLIEAIVRVMKPDPFEQPNATISDVACGTAGFIISSFEWWKTNNSINKLSAKQRQKLFEKTYYGQELVVRPRRLAQMNLYLHGISPQIKLGDTIYEPLSSQKHTCILTNPPFGTKGANEIPGRRDFLVKTSNKQLNFVQHIFSCLADKGRAAIVLPDNVLFEDKATEIWKYLMQHSNIHTILRLPRGTFTPYAQGVKANVIFMQKGVPTKDVWIFDARSNVEGITKKGRPLLHKHFKEFELSYGKDPNGRSNRRDITGDGRFRKISLRQIKERDYNLDISWIKETNVGDNHSELSPEDALYGALERIQSIAKDVTEILNLIEK